MFATHHRLYKGFMTRSLEEFKRYTDISMHTPISLFFQAPQPPARNNPRASLLTVVSL